MYKYIMYALLGCLTLLQSNHTTRLSNLLFSIVRVAVDTVIKVSMGKIIEIIECLMK